MLIRVQRQHAALVGSLLERQLASDDLSDTRLSLLPTFAKKLRKAAARRRATERSDGSITVGTLTKDEGLVGFHYLVLFAYPEVPEDTLTPEDAHAVGQVTLALVAALVARRGPNRLDRAAAEHRVRAWSTSILRDERWVRRVKRRILREDELAGKPLARIPRRLLTLLTK